MNYTRNVLMTWITTMLWSLTQSWTSWNVKSWASESFIMNKASGGDGILAELLKILKEDAVKGLHSIS